MSAPDIATLIQDAVSRAVTGALVQRTLSAGASHRLAPLGYWPQSDDCTPKALYRHNTGQITDHYTSPRGGQHANPTVYRALPRWPAA